MEAMYSKLHDKYIKLKSQKETEIDCINHDQEVKFMDYQSAADELIEHLRNENLRLHSEINNLQRELASIRYSKADQQVEQTENQDKTLSEEIKRLEYGQLTISGSDQVETDTNNILNSYSKRKFTRQSAEVESNAIDSLNSNPMRKRGKHYGMDDEITITRSPSVHPLEIESRSDEFTRTTLCGTDIKFDQPACCRRKVDHSGDGVNASGTTSCLFQNLIALMLGMEVTTASQTDGICILALHQSSGYSFSLTFLEKVGGEAEVAYNVTSLGTFERVAPEWMKEMIIFGAAVLPIFFERVLRVVKGRR